VSSAQRVPSLPSCPPWPRLFRFETGSYQGVLAAAGTPRAIVTRLNAELGRILNTNDMKSSWRNKAPRCAPARPKRSARSSSMKSALGESVKEAGIKAD